MARSLSLCVMTPGPPERVRALLECWREHVDEIVLVVDGSGDRATLDACADLADRRYVVDCSSVVIALGWMLHRCRGDWILRTDDDEVPSAGLLEALPALVRERFATNIALRRRWLYPDARSYVVTRPWLPDHQVRLVRNVPGIWTFPGPQGHGALEVLGERHFSAQAIYHADPLLRAVGERRGKRERLAALQPDLTADGVRVNDVYVPEDHAVALAPVPAADRALIERVLHPPAAPAAPAAAGGQAPVHVSYEELARPTRSRDVLCGAYAARLSIEEPLGQLVAGQARHVEVAAENLGTEWWMPGDLPPWIRLGCRWLDPASGAPTAPEDRALFTETVLPGHRTRVMLRLVAPPQPGIHVLEVDVVHEHVRWFGCAVRARVEVVSG